MTTRNPQVAGMFYPDSKPELENLIGSLLKNNFSEDKYENIFGVIAPHAGYPYSGKTAAFAYNAIAGHKYKTVILISPSHSEYFPGVSIYSGDAYSTPLGLVEVDNKKRDQLAELAGCIFVGYEGHRREHALEVQLPFLQTVLKDFNIVPIVMGDQSPEFIEVLANGIAEIYDSDCLVVASSDLSHFYTKELADMLDKRVENRVKNFDYSGLLTDLENKNCEACGGGPMVALMKSADKRGFTKSKVLSRTDSGSVTGNNNEVVGYLSAVIYK